MTLTSETRAPDGRERARPLSEWTEEDGTVLWWCFPIEEAPYVGSPLDLGHLEEAGSYFVGGWPGYHTHWTPIPMPAEPLSPTLDSQNEGPGR